MTSDPLHLTTVAIDGRAVLIEGPSGAGKSDLALRLIDRGATLVSDDYTVLNVDDGLLYASPPSTIAGRIEVRGVGIVALPYLRRAEVALLVVLGDAGERLPDPVFRAVHGVPIPLLMLNGVEVSAPIKIELMLKRMIQ